MDDSLVPKMLPCQHFNDSQRNGLKESHMLPWQFLDTLARRIWPAHSRAINFCEMIKATWTQACAEHPQQAALMWPFLRWTCLEQCGLLRCLTQGSIPDMAMLPPCQLLSIWRHHNGLAKPFSCVFVCMHDLQRHALPGKIDSSCS